MAIRIPDMNPVRFRKTSDDPDYLTSWPNYRNITQRVDNIPGMRATQFFKDHVAGKPLVVQFETTTSYARTIGVYKYNVVLESYEFYETLTGEDITPAGWLSGDVYKYTFTPAVSGVYKMTYAGAGIESDEFWVHSDIYLKKYLVQIEYYNTENDFGMVFYDGVIMEYSGLSYFTGMLQNIDPANETSAFTNDRGGVEILRKTPVHGAILTLTSIHHTYVENINTIFSCDRVTVNGIEYSSNEKPDVGIIDKSDLVDIKIKLIKREADYYAEA